VKRCKIGILFSHDDYVESAHVQNEVALLSSYAGPQNLLEVQLRKEPKTHQVFSFLDSLPEGNSIEWQGAPSVANIDEINRVLRMVSTKLAREIPPVMPEDEVHVWHEDRKHGLRFDISGFAPSSSLPAGLGAMEFQGEDSEGYIVRWNLTVGGEALASQDISFNGEVIDVRKSFNRTGEFAMDYLLRHGARCTGIHLVYFHGLSHMALSYWWRTSWCRRYSIVLPRRGTDRCVELAFAFSFRGPFTSYCRYIHRMDRVVQSVQFTEDNW